MWFLKRSKVKSLRAVVAAAASVFALTAAAGPARAAAPDPAVLTALACRSTSQCVAVGVNTPTMANRLLSNKWNGSRWSQVAMPSPSGAANVQEGGVSCPSATECVAVGDAFPPRGGDDFATASYWNGARWATGRAADPGTTSELEAVSCPSTSSCFAVGDYGTASALALPLIEHWNGRNWARQAAPLPAGIGQGTLQDVSCASATLCVAVGTSENSTAIEDRWNGRAWSTTSLPNARSVSLYGVSCHTATCFAVGAGNDGASAGTYRLTGTTWSYLRAPAPAGAAGPTLESVSCPLADRCLAVGNYGTAGVFADGWNGHAWVGVPVHQTGGVIHDFEQVSCISWGRCMALGSAGAIAADWRSESAYWNGSSWKITLTA